MPPFLMLTSLPRRWHFREVVVEDDSSVLLYVLSGLRALLCRDREVFSEGPRVLM